MLNLLFCVDCLNAWKGSRHFCFTLSTTTLAKYSINLVGVWSLVTSLSFYQYSCLFELDACLWVLNSVFIWMLISLFLEPSTICCCMDFYLALESREYSHINVGWIQVGERNVYVLMLWLIWGWEKKKKKNNRKKISNKEN